MSRLHNVNDLGEGPKKESMNATTTTQPDTEAKPPRRRFFPLRAICGVIVPPAIAAYFVWTYAQFLRSPTDSSGFRYSASAPDGTLIWWSWFVIGSLGMNINTYVLGGVEAGMLTKDPPWKLNRQQVRMHKDKSWSKLSGWAHMARHVVFRKGHERVDSEEGGAFSWPWALLFTLHFLSWAFVLSGLAMQTEPSFKAGKSLGADVMGTNASTFDDRFTFDILDSAYQAWRQGEEPRIPRLGTFYSPVAEPRDDFNITTANSLPDRVENPIFLSVQGSSPLTGRAFGLALNYSCQPIHKLDDFYILKHRMNSTTPGYIDGSQANLGNIENIDDNDFVFDELPSHYFYEVPDLQGATISVLRENKTIDFRMYANLFIKTVAEVGLSSGILSAMDMHDRSYTTPYGGLSEVEVLEFAFWQVQLSPYLDDRVNGSIPELSGEYKDWKLSGTDSVMEAIGVQCMSSSALGTAVLDGFTGTYTEFEMTKPIYRNSEFPLNVPRLGKSVPAMFIPGVRGSAVYERFSDLYIPDPPLFTPLRRVFSWLSDDIDYRIDTNQSLYPSLPDLAEPLFAAAGVPFGGLGGNETYNGITRYATPQELQRALERAYQHVALRLMYGLNQGSRPWTHKNMTTAVPWTTLVAPENSVPALLILVALVLWALGCVVLTILFSFRKRWDGYFSTASLYWYLRTVNIDTVGVISEIER